MDEYYQICHDEYHVLYGETNPLVNFKISSVHKNSSVFKTGKKKRNQRISRKRTLFKNQNGKCYYCKCSLTFEKSTVDHVIAKSKGGKSNLKNTVVSCFKCNNKKGNQSLEEFLCLQTFVIIV